MSKIDHETTPAPMPTPTATPTPPPTEITRTIDCTYDALHRLTKATYSTGEFFQYTFNEAGSTLQYSLTVASVTTFTDYAYHATYQLATAQGQGGMLWTYTHDAKGQLVEVAPDTGPDGTRRCTYDTPGRLIQTEVHDGSALHLRAEMAYDGLGIASRSRRTTAAAA